MKSTGAEIQKTRVVKMIAQIQNFKKQMNNGKVEGRI